MQVCFVTHDNEAGTQDVRRAAAAAGAHAVVAEPDAAPDALDRQPALILVDEAVARTPGGQIFRELRARSQGRSPLVLVGTRATPPELIEECFRAGMDDCLVRPFDAGELSARLAVVAQPPVVPAGRAAPRVAIAGRDDVLCAELCELLQHCGFHVLRLLGAAMPVQPVDLLVFADPVEATMDLRGLNGALKWLSASSTWEAPVLILRSADGSPAAIDTTGSRVVTVDRQLPLDRLVERIWQLLRRPPGALRAAVRMPFFCPVRFREAGLSTPGAWSSGFSYNVSTGGLFVKSLVPCRKGAPVELRIQLTTLREELAATGVVSWSNPYQHAPALAFRVGMGVQFLGAVSPTLSRLMAACAADAA